MLFFSQNTFHTFCNSSGMSHLYANKSKFKMNVLKNSNGEV